MQVVLFILRNVCDRSVRLWVNVCVWVCLRVCVWANKTRVSELPAIPLTQLQRRSDCFLCSRHWEYSVCAWEPSLMIFPLQQAQSRTRSDEQYTHSQVGVLNYDHQRSTTRLFGQTIKHWPQVCSKILNHFPITWAQRSILHAYVEYGDVTGHFWIVEATGSHCHTAVSSPG